VNNCKHKWSILTNDDRYGPGISKCEKCGLWLYHSNRLQLEINHHVVGFQKKIAVTALFVSIIALFASVGVPVAIWWFGIHKQPAEPLSCTMEAKLCPDGSAVGRTGPNCEFAACPEVK